MNNSQIADQFSLLARLMDLHGENSFRSKSYSSIAYNIERLPREIVEMDDAELFSIKGIGESTGHKIRDMIATGRFAQLDEMIAQTPAGILEMMQIKGLGPKKIAVIWHELGIESVGELEYACNENRLTALKGFGAKTQDAILESIAYIRQNQGFHLWAEAMPFAHSLLAALQATFDDCRFSTTGALRRQCEVIEYIDIITDAPGNEIAEALQEMPGAELLDSDDGLLGLRMEGMPPIRVHLANAVSYWQRLFETTGSDDFMAAFKEKYRIPASPGSEEEIFTANGLQPVLPACRETATALTAVPADVIQPGDIKAIIHSHSTWSDGQHTLEQMALAARDKGFEYLVISDHSQTASYAGGLKPDRVAAQHQEIDALNARLAPFKIFKSIESDILADGSLDYSPQVLHTFDLVIASVHSNLKMTEEKAMERVLAAVRNPFTTILGHPTGRLLLSRPGYPLDHKKLIDECVANNVVIEINAHPRRLDMDWRWIAYAMERGALLSVDPDAHSVDGFKDTFYGIMVAQKGGLTAARNLSSYSLAAFEIFLQKYKAKVAAGGA